MPEATNKEVLEPIDEGISPTLADIIVDLVEKKGYSIKISPCWKDGSSQITLEKGTHVIILQRVSIIEKFGSVANKDLFIIAALNYLERKIEGKEKDIL